jgi:hypothetical protein
MNDPDVRRERRAFSEGVAPTLAAAVGVSRRWDGQGSTRFAYFADESRFVVAAGEQEDEDSDLALAYGLTYRANRKLVLVLPEERAFSTLQRVPWLCDDARPDVWLHDGSRARPITPPTKSETVRALSTRLVPGGTLEDELTRAATPFYLGQRAADVFDLVEWATKHPDLDPGHRKGERSWHCMGQRVLSIKGTTGGLNVRAGIHFTSNPGPTAFVRAGSTLRDNHLEQVRMAVEAGIKARRAGGFTKANEHWLQAVIPTRPGTGWNRATSSP